MKKYLVYDVGGSAIKYAIMNEEKIVLKDKVKTPKDNLEGFLTAVEKIYQEHKQEIAGVAFSMPGIIDTETGFVMHAGNLLYIRKVNLKEKIEERLKTTISIENDGKSAVLGEVWKGKLHGIKNGVALILGTGVGGGIILNGQLIKGHHLGAGEFSPIRTNDKRPLKPKDSFGAIGSTVNLVERVANEIGEDPDEFSGENMFSKIKEGNKQAKDLFSQYCEAIAFQIMSLQSILDPEYIVIGGGMSEEPMFVKGIKEAVDQLYEEDFMTEINGYKAQVVKSELNNEANLYGALYQYLLTENDKNMIDNFK